MAWTLITNVLRIGLVTVLISGCAAFTNTTDLAINPVEKPILVLPAADELRIREVSWTVITQENFREKATAIQNSGEAVAFFALTGKGYENLGLNFSDIRLYISQQQEIIAAYKRYYQAADRQLEQANQQLHSAEQSQQNPGWLFWGK